MNLFNLILSSFHNYLRNSRLSLVFSYNERIKVNNAVYFFFLHTRIHRKCTVLFSLNITVIKLIWKKKLYLKASFTAKLKTKLILADPYIMAWMLTLYFFFIFQQKIHKCKYNLIKTLNIKEILYTPRFFFRLMQCTCIYDTYIYSDSWVFFNVTNCAFQFVFLSKLSTCIWNLIIMIRS